MFFSGAAATRPDTWQESSATQLGHEVGGGVLIMHERGPSTVIPPPPLGKTSSAFPSARCTVTVRLNAIDCRINEQPLDRLAVTEPLTGREQRHEVWA